MKSLRKISYLELKEMIAEPNYMSLYVIKQNVFNEEFLIKKEPFLEEPSEDIEEIRISLEILEIFEEAQKICVFRVKKMPLINPDLKRDLRPGRDRLNSCDFSELEIFEREETCLNGLKLTSNPNFIPGRAKTLN